MKFSVEDILMEEIFKHHEFDSKTVECISKSEIKTISEFHRLIKKCRNINYLQSALGLREYGKDDLDEIITYTNYLLIPGFDFDDAEHFCNTNIGLFKTKELRDEYMTRNNASNDKRLLWLIFCANLLDFAWINHFVE
ncbi:MAG: hypothetical protein MJ160_06055 [Treponema sp.]|nr:hypothetical protein [Treponema sp.]